MEHITEEEFEKAKELYPEEIIELDDVKVTDKDFEKLLVEMENPVQAQKKLAVQIKVFLDKRIIKEINSEKGILSDHTRRWVESYNNILEKIQKALHGDKSVNLHIHKITPSFIAAKMRESLL